MGKCHSGCVFCALVQNKTREFLFENDSIVIFADRSPIGRIHLQCISKQHIKNINSLNSSHIELLETMKREAINYIISVDAEINPNTIKLGFHIPPFTSVKHLHMHCIVPPYYNMCTKCFKVDVIFRSVDKVIHNLKVTKENQLNSQSV